LLFQSFRLRAAVSCASLRAAYTWLGQWMTRVSGTAPYASFAPGNEI
jgi:hypothetical protein